MPGYQALLSYQLSKIVFDLTWEFVPVYFFQKEDARQRDQMKQAARSFKQNIVEGSEERSLSSKLKLYDVARASASELMEDYEDILRLAKLLRWDRHDQRLFAIRKVIEKCLFSPSGLSFSSCSSVLDSLEGTRRTRGIRWTRGDIEILVNYIIDITKRASYLLDQQIRAVEEKHMREGGYREKLLQKRLIYRRTI